MPIKIIDTVDLEKIISELLLLEKIPDITKHSVNGDEDFQYLLQGSNESIEINGTTRLIDGKAVESSFILDLYSDLMPYTYMVINEFQLIRTRALTLQPKTCYSYHVDGTQRIHIPITSNENCFMVIDDKVYRMPADGSIYMVDTTKMHTAINANRNWFNRMHLVGAISYKPS